MSTENDTNTSQPVNSLRWQTEHRHHVAALLVIVPIQHLLRALDPPLCRDELSGTPVDSNPYHKRGNKRDSHAGQDFSFDRNQLKKKG